MPDVTLPYIWGYVASVTLVWGIGVGVCLPATLSSIVALPVPMQYCVRHVQHALCERLPVCALVCVQRPLVPCAHA